MAGTQGSATGKIPDPIGGITHEDLTLTGSEQSVPSEDCRSVTIEADGANSGTIYLGGTGVDSSSYGRTLAAGATFTMAECRANCLKLKGTNGDILHILKVSS